VWSFKYRYFMIRKIQYFPIELFSVFGYKNLSQDPDLATKKPLMLLQESGFAILLEIESTRRKPDQLEEIIRRYQKEFIK
jgi:hypothetical protein